MFRNLLRPLRPYLMASAAALLWAPASALAQETALKKADSYFDLEDYHTAASQYEQIIREHPESGIAKFKAGVCYLYTGQAYKGLQFIRQSGNMNTLEIDPYYYFWLGKAYHLNMRIDSALLNYRRYLADAPASDAFRKGTENLIAQAHRTESYFVNPDANPLYARNLGENINSPYTERNPMMTADGKVIVFSSRRPLYPEEQPMADGEYVEKSFVSQLQADGTWSKAQPILAPADRKSWYTAVQLIDGGRALLLLQEGKDGGFFSAPRQGDQFGQPTRIELGVKAAVTAYDVAFTSDLKHAVYSRLNRSTGDIDLYDMRKESSGSWTKPVRISSVVNTLENEVSPMFSPDGKTLYYASKGLEGLGGFDLFKATVDPATGRWNPAENMGMPYNSPGNDISYLETLIEGKKTGLLCASRPRGLGEADIYIIDFTGMQAANKDGF